MKIFNSFGVSPMVHTKYNVEAVFVIFTKYHHTKMSSNKYSPNSPNSSPGGKKDQRERANNHEKSIIELSPRGVRARASVEGKLNERKMIHSS